MKKVYITMFAIFILRESVFSQDIGYWVTRAPMPTQRQEIPHTVLNNKIYIAGGIESQGSTSTVMEVYDPSTNTWTSVAAIPEPLHHHSMVELNDKIYLIGGHTGTSFNPTNKVYEYDPVTDNWIEKASLPIPLGAHTAAVYDGKIYVFGGVSNQTVLNTAFVYDLAADRWDNLAPMPTAREHLSCAVADTLICVIGGRSGSQNTNANEIYSPSTNQWTTGADMPTARGGLAAAGLNGRIYVFGGEIPDVFEENEEYDISTDTWRTMAPMTTPRHGIGAAVVGDTIFIIGGATVAGFGSANINEGFVYSDVTNVNDNSIIPNQIILHQNYPNPFNPETKIRYTLNNDVFVSIKVYDVLGNEISTLINREQSAGVYEVSFNGKNISSGIYYYTLRSGNHTFTKKMILLN